MKYKRVDDKGFKLAVIGLGYVGLPLAVAFSKKLNVVGFDVNKQKINEYIKGNDSTGEVGNFNLKRCKVTFTNNEKELELCNFHIVAVPTPINEDKTPDLRPVIGASKILGRRLTKGSIVVYESTVYPGVTEEVCIPILEEESGLKCGIDFKIGYSPERINPGDKKHRLNNIIKIVSGMDEESLEIIAEVYEKIIKAGVYRAESIKVAEAAKVIENSQRDINIAFMNELSIIFNKMGIDTKAVLRAAGTKWNFINFTPGLVGGHCIGVDPYYLTYKAEQLGYHSQIILSGRRINDGVGKYIAENIIKKLIDSGQKVQGARVGILGFTFKENCPDTRNTKVVDIINELKEYGVEVLVTDPLADKFEVEEEYNLKLNTLDEIKDINVVVMAVAHEQYKNLTVNDVESLFVKDERAVIIDIKGIWDKKDMENKDYLYWSL